MLPELWALVFEHGEWHEWRGCAARSALELPMPDWPRFVCASAWCAQLFWALVAHLEVHVGDAGDSKERPVLSDERAGALLAKTGALRLNRLTVTAAGAPQEALVAALATRTHVRTLSLKWRDKGNAALGESLGALTHLTSATLAGSGVRHHLPGLRTHTHLRSLHVHEHDCVPMDLAALAPLALHTLTVDVPLVAELKQLSALSSLTDLRICRVGSVTASVAQVHPP